MSKSENNKKIGLVLGSGAARGLAHIGVLKCLKKNNIPIDYISGSSIGAVIGAMYSVSQKIEEIEKAVIQADWRLYLSLLDPRLSGGGMIKGDKIKDFMQKFIGLASFSDLKIPLTISATDFQTGKKIYLQKGNLLEAVMASSAIPLIFEPKKIDGQILVDGGLSSPLPVAPLKKQGADIVIAVNLDNDYFSDRKRNFSAGIMALQTIQLLRYHLADLEASTADVVISPKVGNIMGFSFISGKKAIDLGYQATKKMMPKIKSLLI